MRSKGSRCSSCNRPASKAWRWVIGKRTNRSASISSSKFDSNRSTPASLPIRALVAISHVDIPQSRVDVDLSPWAKACQLGGSSWPLRPRRDAHGRREKSMARRATASWLEARYKVSGLRVRRLGKRDQHSIIRRHRVPNSSPQCALRQLFRAHIVIVGMRLAPRIGPIPATSAAGSIASGLADQTPHLCRCAGTACAWLVRGQTAARASRRRALGFQSR